MRYSNNIFLNSWAKGHDVNSGVVHRLYYVTLLLGHMIVQVCFGELMISTNSKILKIKRSSESLSVEVEPHIVANNRFGNIARVDDRKLII